MERLKIEAVVDENGAYRTRIAPCDHRESLEEIGEKKGALEDIKGSGGGGKYGDKGRGREGVGGGGDGEEEGEGWRRRRGAGGHTNAPDIPLFFSPPYI